jgi:hypothetical protein
VKKIYVILFGTVMLLGLAIAPVWATWIQVGDSINLDTGKATKDTSLTQYNGVPYIAWCEEASDGHMALNVKHWNGTAWVLDANRLNILGYTDAFYPALAVYNGTPYVAWCENLSVYVKHWNGLGWQQDGSSVNANLAQIRPFGFVFSNGTPYIAYVERQGIYDQVLVKHWTGGAWQQDGGNLNSNINTNAANPSLAVSNDNTVYVTYYDDDPNYGFLVKHWGGAWVQDGGVIPGPRMGASVLIAMLNTTPYVTFGQWNGTNTVLYMKYLNGANWSDGGYLNNDFNKQFANSSLTICNGIPYVAWEETNGVTYQLYVKHWNGNAWVPDGTSLNMNLNQNADKNVSVVDINGTPFLAWCESNGTNTQVYVKRMVPDCISLVDPNYSTAERTAQVSITGSGFAPPPVAKLIRSGSPDIASTGATQNSAFNFTYTFPSSIVKCNT